MHEISKGGKFVWCRVSNAIVAVLMLKLTLNFAIVGQGSSPGFTRLPWARDFTTVALRLPLWWTTDCSIPSRGKKRYSYNHPRHNTLPNVDSSRYYSFADNARVNIGKEGRPSTHTGKLGESVEKVDMKNYPVSSSVWTKFKDSFIYFMLQKPSFGCMGLNCMRFLPFYSSTDVISKNNLTST